MEISCSICHEEYNGNADISTTRCGHVFHSQCIQQWLTRSRTCPECRQRCMPTVKLYLKSDCRKSEISVHELKEQLAYKNEENYIYQNLVESLQYKMTRQVAAKNEELEEMITVMHKQREMFKQASCASKTIINTLKDELEQKILQLEDKSLQIEEELRISALKTHDIKIFENVLKSNYVKYPSNQLKYHKIDSIENENLETVNEEENYTKHSIRINGLTGIKGSSKNFIMLLAEQMGIMCSKEDIDSIIILPPTVFRNSKPCTSWIVNFKENDLKKKFLTNEKKLNEGATNQFVKIVDYKPSTLRKRTKNDELFDRRK